MTAVMGPTGEDRRVAMREEVRNYVATMPTVEEMARPVLGVIYDLHEIAGVVHDACVLADDAGPAAETLLGRLDELGHLVESVVSGCIPGSAAGPARGAEVRRALEAITGVGELRNQHYRDRAWEIGHTV